MNTEKSSVKKIYCISFQPPRCGKNVGKLILLFCSFSGSLLSVGLAPVDLIKHGCQPCVWRASRTSLMQLEDPLGGPPHGFNYPWKSVSAGGPPPRRY